MRATLGQRDQVLAQAIDVLLDREATDFACLPAVPIEDVGAGPIDPEELMLDHQRRIAGPAGNPDEILVGGHGTINQHHRRRRAAILGDQLAPQIEQHDDEILVDHPDGTEPINQERPGRVAAQDALGVLLAVSFAPMPSSDPSRHWHRRGAPG